VRAGSARLLAFVTESSEIQRRGRITKAGNTRMRWLLVEAARCVMRGKKKPETAALREWGDRIAQRRGDR